jgi:hypothetical protein
LAPSVPLAPSAPLARKNITFLEGNVELNSLEIQDLTTEGESDKKNLAWNVNLEETRVIEDSYLQELEKRIVSLEKQIQFLSEIKEERKSETQEKTQEKEIQTLSISEWESEPNPEDERKEIEEIIESVILSIEQQT